VKKDEKEGARKKEMKFENGEKAKSGF